MVVSGAGMGCTTRPCTVRSTTWVKARPDATESDAETQGLTLAHFKAQLEDLRDTLLTSELNLSTFGTHSRLLWVTWENK